MSFFLAPITFVFELIGFLISAAFVYGLALIVAVSILWYGISTIPKTETEYIDLAEKIVLDREFRHNIKCKIKDKENYLYRNENAIRALEDFFEGVISDSLKSEVQN